MKRVGLLLLGTLLFGEEAIVVKAKRVKKERPELMEEISERLQRKAGIFKLRKGAYGKDVVIRIFNSDKLGIVIEGQRIFRACPMAMDPPLAHIDSAFVGNVKVSPSLSVEDYGSLGGKVKVSFEEPREGRHLKSKVGGDSFGGFAGSLTYSQREWDSYLLIGHAYRSSKPYKDGKGKYFTQYANYKSGVESSKSYENNTTLLKLRRGKFRLTLSYQDLRHVLYPYLSMDAKVDRTYAVGITYGGREFKLNLYYNDIYHLMNNSLRKAPMFMENLAKRKTYGFKVMGRRGNLKYGFEYLSTFWDSNIKMMKMEVKALPNTNFQDFGLFLETKGKNLKGGLRLDYTLSRGRGSRVSDFLVSSFLKFKRKIFFIRGGLSSKSPNLEERFFQLKSKMKTWLGNKSLKPTKNAQIEVGVRKRSLKLTLFYNYLFDYTYLYPLQGGGFTYTNVNAQLYGMELSYIKDFNPKTSLIVNASTRRGIKSPKGSLRDKDLAEVPPTRVDLTLKRKFNRRVSILLNGRWQDSQTNVDSDLKERITPSYFVLSAGLDYKRKRLKLSMKVDNLLNTFYYEHLSYLRNPYYVGNLVPEPGRSVSLSLEMTF